MESIRSTPRRDPRWYACYTRARHEKKVAEVLAERGVEHYLPLVSRERRWADRSTTVEFPLFAGYLFARFPLDEVTRVVSIPGVADVVRNLGTPSAIPQEDLDNVRRFVDALNAHGGELEPEPVPLPEEGTRVRITSGPFEGVTGVVLERRGRRRVLVGVESVGVGVAVDVGGEALKAIELTGAHAR